MKLSFVFFPLLLAASSVFGQVSADGGAVSTSVVRPFTAQTNWFASIGVGGQVYFGDHNKQVNLGGRITPSFDLSAGKWINASFGLRAGLSGFKMKGATQNGSHSTGEIYDASQWLDKQSFNFMYAHADLLFDWTNDIYGGYTDRMYHLIPYAGLGVATVFDKPKATNFSPNLGVLQTFRLSDKLDFMVDVRGNLLGDGFDGEKGGRKFEGNLITQVGLTYNFN